MSGIATAAVVVGAVGAAVQSDAARRAAHTQADAANQANNTQLEMFNQQREDQAPWREAGGESINALLNGLGLGEGGTGQGPLNKPFSMSDFAVDPGYQFTQQQGELGLDRALAAQGRFGSGALLKDAMQFNQGLAGTQYQNAFDRYMQQQTSSFNRLASIAGLGQNSVTALGNQSAVVGGQMGQNIVGAGNANAAGTIGQGNALSSGMNGAFNNILMAQYMKNWNNPSTSYSAQNDSYMAVNPSQDPFGPDASLGG